MEGWQSSKQEQPTIDGSGEGVVAVDDDGGDGRTAAGNDNGRASDDERARTAERARDG